VARVRPVDVLLVDPGGLGDRGVGEAVAEGLRAGGLLERVAAVAGVADGVVVESALVAFCILDGGLDFFLRGKSASTNQSSMENLGGVITCLRLKIE